MVNVTRANNFFDKLKQSTVERYSKYWDSVKPTTYNDFFKRYLFAITSVHTTWAGNVRGYNALKDLGWFDDKEDLRQRLIFARCGMFNVRTEAIWKFKTQFWANPSRYCETTTNWTKHRNDLVKEINGLGMAKVSFTLEMCFPLDAQVTCVDTHGIQLYEIPMVAFKSKKEVEVYETAEKHWVDRSNEKNCAPMVARAIYWDKLQNRRNPRYWSYVLEA